ncbi:MAG: sn-glycerol-3-phosphate ABC transporter ATP-binding protein UgpC [Gaiellaceae bacterium]
MASVTFSQVDKVYPDGTQAVTALDLEIGDGEFMVLVGPSGCGKTTALRMVAGLEGISAGTVRIGDRVVNDLEPRHRDIAMVFQNYALYPNMTVFENIAFGLKLRKMPRAEIRVQVEQMAQVLGLSDLLHRKPAVLSGGQRQRVAMGRAIVRRPSAFLMDEPLSNLDAKLRVQMRAEIARIQREVNATTLYVTHDQIEAMTMGTRVAVMRKGELQQVAAPRELYVDPVNLFVASFIGSPAMNLLDARLERVGGGLGCRVGDQLLRLPEDTVAKRPALAGYVGRAVGVGIRPEHLTERPRGLSDGEVPVLKGRIVTTEVLGSEVLVHVGVDADPVMSEEVREVAADVDPAALVDIELAARDHRAVVVARFPADSTVGPDDLVDMVVETRALQFFDLENELAIRAG